ncbi:uncharacterized protein V1510DRAFT_404858 [Dipodascopsis tothii]|uniref:uncharacterized protein n=1 Tax=Dipodascopsis tothii TaxID=44089 RepID=UPI0034CDD08A
MEPLPESLRYHILKNGDTDLYLATNPNEKHFDDPVGPSYYVQIRPGPETEAADGAGRADARAPSLPAHAGFEMTLLVHRYDAIPDAELEPTSTNRAGPASPVKGPPSPTKGPASPAKSRPLPPLPTDGVPVSPLRERLSTDELTPADQAALRSYVENSLVPVMRIKCAPGATVIELTVVEQVAAGGDLVEKDVWHGQITVSELWRNSNGWKSVFHVLDPFDEEWFVTGKGTASRLQDIRGGVISAMEKKIVSGAKLGWLTLQSRALLMLDVSIAVHTAVYAFWTYCLGRHVHGLRMPTRADTDVSQESILPSPVASARTRATRKIVGTA